ncbi:zinc-binding dehydrogenase [Streptomyces sp. NBC_00582]|uniref:zinc-binding dehydrogenase n=1 Tax=Streptomyces sp. NBC_00582 TaxID=2975783 RepID=UPI002E80BF07|nr:zinc-binding dehydrogenase [Streptomyces sp. NBC_00582]WUB59549.1 zinc-binding dehydrogenase [Streptomyces sp. NBC_00582]
MTTMRAALLRGFEQPLTVEEVELLDLAPTRVLVRTGATPFCSTDVTSFHGRLGKVPPTILGHASAGEVVEVGSQVRGIEVGQRVVVPGTPECGHCFYCGIGRPDQCSELFDLGGVYPDVARTSDGLKVNAAGCVGGYAEMMNVSQNQVFPVDTDLPWEVLSLLGCGITTGVGAVLNVARVQPDEVVAVVGAGHLGLWAVQAARLAGAREVVVIEPREERRGVATKAGATAAVAPEDALETVRGLTQGRGADKVIETAGPPAAQRLALEISRRAGTVVLSGLKDATGEVTFGQIPLAVQSRQVLSTQNGNVRMRRDLPAYVRLLERGALDPSPVITSTYRLEDINTALERSERLEDLSGVFVF